MNADVEVAPRYIESTVGSRTEAECSACDEVIPLGEYHTSVRILFEGQWETLRRCRRCQAMHEHLRSLQHCYDESWPDDRLNCGHDYNDVHRVQPPPHIAALAFLLPGEVVPQPVEDVARLFAGSA